MRKRHLFFVCVIFAVLACAAGQEPTKVISRQISNVRNLFPYRATFTGKIIDARFDPNASDYLQSLGVLALFGGVCIVITLLWSFFFPLLRRMGFLGGSEPMIGCFRGPTRKKPYPKCQVITFKILTFIMLGLVIFLSVFGFVANDTVNKGVESSRSVLRDTALTLANQTVQIREQFAAIVQFSNTSDPQVLLALQSLNDMASKQSNASSTTRTLMRDVGRGNKVRFAFLAGVLAFAILTPLLLVLSAIGNWKARENYHTLMFS
jgi:hypothetical protein